MMLKNRRNDRLFLMLIAVFAIIGFFGVAEVISQLFTNWLGSSIGGAAYPTRETGDISITIVDSFHKMTGRWLPENEVSLVLKASIFIFACLLAAYISLRKKKA